MKKKTVRILAALLLGICVPACALAYDANIAQAWLEQFSAALVQITPINDPDATADPARAGQMLFAYDFGTVLSKSDHPGAQDIQEIEIRNAQVTDCRGVRVGMDIGKTFSGQQPGKSVTPLYVLGTQENGWHWAYLKDGQVYGVEYIAYGEAAQTMNEAMTAVENASQKLKNMSDDLTKELEIFKLS